MVNRKELMEWLESCPTDEWEMKEVIGWFGHPTHYRISFPVNEEGENNENDT